MTRYAALIFCLLPVLAMAQQVSIEGLRTWPAPDNTRLVFDLSAPVDYKLFSLKNPARLVIDIRNVQLEQKLQQPGKQDRFLKRIRSATRNKTDLRVVLDLNEGTKYKSFLLKPYRQYGHRLVIDVYEENQKTGKIVKRGGHDDNDGLRDLVIAIDAGHGGEDPGAQGPHGTYEKDVVLALARSLAARMEQERGMQPVLIRSGDYFLSLRQRTLRARSYKADLFVSIHADAFDDSRVRGSSVYVLSKNGASNEAARWLAAKENASDLIGGVSLEDKDDLLASVLLDLSQTATIEYSYNAAEKVLVAMKSLGTLHKRHVQQAGFAVLKSPDIPSMLIETAFISNPDEERKLRSRKFQHDFANTVLAGIRTYFTENPPAGTLYAARQHTIVRGDTLSDLAQHYKVSVDNLRRSNKLKSDTLRVGQTLHIPVASGG